MDMPKLIAKLRLQYHANLLDVNNILNQLHIMSDKKAEENNRKHTMVIFNDILPRIYGQMTVDEMLKKEDPR